jgi:cysteine sulfinate desulfinase/cysteine desulfurase-like protein
MASFRIGIGADTTEEDADRLLASLPVLVEELRRVDAAAEVAMSRYRPPDA